MIDPEAAALALIEARGSIPRAARAMGVQSRELRKLIWSDMRLQEAALEAAERELDKAESILLDGLDEPDKLKRLDAARLILRGHFKRPR